MPEPDERDDQQPEDQPDAGGDGAAGSGEPDWKAEAEKWKGHARKHEAEAKRLRPAAERLKEIEESQKSESEKQAEALREAQGKAAAAERELIRTRVALRKGLSESMAKRLQGDTEEEIEADADELLSSLKRDDDGGDEGADRAPLRRPQERMRPGARSAAEPEKSVKEVVAAIPRSSF
ncbi:MAG: hypothetical protein AB7L91_06325 [Dehalococcoidia bacterium]